MKTRDLEDRDFERLVRDMKDKRCVLLLGSNMEYIKYDTGEYLSLNEVFALTLSKELEKEKLDFDKSEKKNLHYIAQKFLSIPGARRVDLESEMKSIYDRYHGFVPSVYEKLAQYPFQLIINTGPDDFMLRALKSCNRNPNFAWYDFNKNEEFDWASMQNEPLVYNLFGSFNDAESLVITEDDELNFVKNILQGNPPVPSYILSQFDQRKSYLFFDFDLRDWHFRLLLEIFSLNFTNNNDNIKSLSPKFSKSELNTRIMEFFENRYSFQFIDKNVQEFSKDLMEFYDRTYGTSKEPSKPKKVFIDYADEDKDEYFKPLMNNLKPFENKDKIDIFHVGDILAGEIKHVVRNEKLRNADVIILLISAYYLASPTYLQDISLILNQEKSNAAKVIPVLVKDCSWRETEIARLDVLPKNKIPISNKEHWPDIYDAINKIVEELKIHF